MEKSKSYAVSAEQAKRWTAEERYFSTLSNCFIPISTNIHGIEPLSDDIGYTYTRKFSASLIAEIFICRFHEIMKTLSEKERSFFRLGVYSHEALHQIYTDFDTRKAMADKITSPIKKKLFAEVSNIVEDTRIEYYARDVIGGEMLSALQFTISVIYKDSEIGKETSPIAQALNALIMLGDMGFIKGKFTFPEAFDIFKRIAPLFEKAVRLTSSTKALDISIEITEIIFEYVDTSLEELLSELFKSSDSRENSGKGSDAEPLDDESDDESEGDGDSDSKKSSSSSKKKRAKAKKLLDELGASEDKSEDDEKSESSDETVGSGSSPKEEKPLEDYDDYLFGDDTVTLDSFDTELSSIDDFESCETKDEKNTSSSKPTETSDESPSLKTKPECSISEEDLETANSVLQEIFDKTEEKPPELSDFKEDVEKTNSKIKEEIEAKEKEDKKEASDTLKDTLDTEVRLKNDPFTSLLVNKKMPPCDPSSYAILYEQVAPLISSTKRAIERALKNEEEDTVRHTSGEINLKRYHDVTYNSARVFDKRRDPKNSSDTCILILGDESGSMSGSRANAMRLSIILLTEVCALLKVPCYVVGYSADEIYREVDLRHYVTWKNTKADRTSLVSIKGREQNRDGASIRAVTEIAKKRHEERKILFVLSDGQPCANNYRGKPAVLDTKNAIREAHKIFSTVVGVSIGSSDINILHEMYGNDFLSVTEAVDLPVELSKLFRKMFK